MSGGGEFRNQICGCQDGAIFAVYFFSLVAFFIFPTYNTKRKNFSLVPAILPETPHDIL